MIIATRRLFNGPAVRSGEDVRVAGEFTRGGARRQPNHHDMPEMMPDAPQRRRACRGNKPEQEPPQRSTTSSRQLAAWGRYARRDLALAIAAPLVAGLLLLPQLWLFARAIQAAVVEGATTAALMPTVMGIVGLMAARALLVRGGEIHGSRAAAAITLSLRKALFRHLLRQRPDWSASRPSGELSGAIMEQVQALEAYFARYVPAMALAAVLPILFALTAFVVEPVIGVLFLISAPLIPVFMALVGWGAEAASAQHQQAFLRLSGFFADRLRGLVTLKLLGRAGDETRRLREAGDDLRARTLDVLRIAFLSSAVLEFFAALGIAGVALYVGLTYLGFLHFRTLPLTLETGLFCLVLAPEVYLPLRQFAAHYHDRAAAKAALAGLEALFEHRPSLDEAGETPAADGRPLQPQAATIILSKLTILTPGTARSVLADVELRIGPASHVAIVGPSGSGKSTVLEALAGLRAVQGRIAFDGIPILEISDNEFRARVAILGQRPRLFDATIARNIRFGREDARDDEVLDAAERAGVLRFAKTLPDGVMTPVGEGGLGLSGGEAHRVALARIFLRQPDLILLDEPTAHLDPETEQTVLDGILAFAKGRTLVIATHSRAVMDRMDRVLRIEGHRLLVTAPKPSSEGAGLGLAESRADTRPS